MPKIENLPFRECIACDIQHHRLLSELDHPDGSVTLDKLSQEVKDKLDASISKGDGGNSLVSGTSVAIAENDISLGDNNVAGRKAYYIKAIDNKNKKIYLSNERVYPPASLDDANLVDTTFETPAYDVGDEFSVLWGAYRHFVDTIATIENNVVTWAGDTLFTKATEDNEEDAYTFHVPSKPEVGIVEMGTNAFVVGVDNKANGTCTLVGGKGNIASGNYALVGGKNNKAGFGCIVGGNTNTITGNNSFGGGLFNILKSTYGGVLGLSNTVTCDTEEAKGDHPVGLNFVFGRLNVIDALRTFIFGLRNKIKGTDHNVLGSDNELNGEGNKVIGNHLKDNSYSKDQVILGVYNKPDKDARFIVGNGTDEDNRSNALVVKKTNEAVFDGKTIFNGETVVNGETIFNSPVYAQPEYATTWGSDGTTYGVKIPGVTELKVGTTIRIILHKDSTYKTPYLRVNEFDYKEIRRVVSRSNKTKTGGTTENWLSANTPIELVYDGTYWICNSMTRPHASDLYGTTPVSNGGTGVSSVAANHILVGQGGTKALEPVSINSLDISKNTVIADLQKQIDELKTLLSNN